MSSIPTAVAVGPPTPSQPNISLVPKKDASGKPIPDTVDGTLVRIRLFDDRERVLFFKDNPSPTAKQVCEMIAAKLDLQPDSIDSFSLWIAIPDLELQIRPKMELFDMAKKWPRWVEKYTHAQTSDSQPKLVFKREAMVTRLAESKLTDQAAIKLLYGEARSAVMAGRYPLASVDEAAELAAYQAQILHGDYLVAKHGPGSGFLTQNLTQLVPKYYITRVRTLEWEQRIGSFWARMAGMRDIRPYSAYLEYARKWPVYGSTFFPACKNIPPSGYFELRTDHLWVAVNAEGLTIVDDDKHKASWHGVFQGVEWDCSPDSITIEYTPPRAKDQPPPKKMGSTLITPQSHLIDSLASRAIYNIEKREQRKNSAAINGNAAKRQSTAAAAGVGVNSRKRSSTINTKNGTVRGAPAALHAGPRPTSAAGSDMVAKTASIASGGGGDQSSPAASSTPIASKRVSAAEERPENTFVVYDDKEDPSEYLKAMTELRKTAK